MFDPKTAADESLPHNIEAEQAVLSAILLQNEVIDGLTGLVSDDFFDPVHQRLFADMQSYRASHRAMRSRFGSIW